MLRIALLNLAQMKPEMKIHQRSLDINFFKIHESFIFYPSTVLSILPIFILT